MRLSKITLGLFIACLAAAGCTRDNDIIYPPDAPVGGKGGKAVLRVTPRHHGKNIDSCVIKLAYDNNNFPAKGWDEVKNVVIVNGEPVATFDSLAPGQYFIYAEGWDSYTEITNGPADVYGSGPFYIRDSMAEHHVYMDVNDLIDHVHTPQD